MFSQIGQVSVSINKQVRKGAETDLDTFNGEFTGLP